MHELSVALRIVEALDQELAGESDDLTVSAVHIEVGTLTGLVPEALAFAWDLATEESILKGSRLEMQTVAAAGYCSQCQQEQTLTNIQSMRCPACRSPITRISGGNELEIISVELAPALVQLTTHG